MVFGGLDKGSTFIQLSTDTWPVMWLIDISTCTRNKRTTVELRDESFVTGRVVQADGFMNIHMEEVTLTDPRGSRLKFESFFVQRRQIR